MSQATVDYLAETFLPLEILREKNGKYCSIVRLKRGEKRITVFVGKPEAAEAFYLNLKDVLDVSKKKNEARLTAK